MATINKYQTSTGAQRYRVLWRDPSGRQKSKSFDKWQNANDFRIKLEHELREGSYVEPSKITVGQLLDDWLEIHRIGLQHNTVQGYEYNVRHIKNAIGNKYIQRLTPGDIERMYKALSEELSGKYLQEIHATLNLALKHAVKTHLLNSNPCDVVARPKKTKFQAAFIRPEDVERYLSIFKNCWMYPAVVLALFCGLRRGELLALRWNDINFKSGEITVKHSLEERGKEKVLKAPKNGKSRTVHMMDGVAAVLKQHRKRQLEFKLILGKQYHTSDFVIVEDDGTQPAPSYLSRYFARKIARSGLPRIRFHDLRHTAASLMLLEGVDLKTVSEILGHSGISITADIYAHVIDEAKKQAAERLEKYLKNE